MLANEEFLNNPSDIEKLTWFVYTCLCQKGQSQIGQISQITHLQNLKINITQPSTWTKHSADEPTYTVT